MAANLYPQGMTLHTIGFAALKYPELPPELPIPIGNQLGVLQRTPLNQQIRVMAHVASQYLPTLIEYQTGDGPHLHDPASDQYYISNALAIINWCTSNPDVAVAVAKQQTIFQAVVDKLLLPNVEKDMKACSRMGGASFEADLGSMMQFLSTILMRSEYLPTPPHPRILELVPILKAWRRKYSGQFIARVSDRLATQIKDPETLDVASVREAQNQNLVCGYIACGEKSGLNACARCKMQRYCSQEHQKKDWGFHKKICRKGLLDE